MQGVLVRRVSCAVVVVALSALAGCKEKEPAAGAAADRPVATAPVAGAADKPATTGAAAGNASASATGATLPGEALARARTCLACHQVDRKQVGPAYRDVAARFADNPDAVNILSAAIRNGGRGQWGAVPMPAQPQVSEAEAAELARWILSLKP